MRGMVGIDITREVNAGEGLLRSLTWEPGIDAGAARSALRAEGPDVRVETSISIREIGDIVAARRAGTLMAKSLGFSESRITLVSTAISELARNILLYAGSGEIVLSRLNGALQGVVVKAIDRGPGIADLQGVMAGGVSTSGGLGLGLSGLRHIMDSFEIHSQPGEGTQVVVGLRAG